MSLFPVIDYDVHPGFAGLRASHPDTVADGMIASIEESIGAVIDRPGSPEERLADFDRNVAPKISDLLRHLTAGDKAGPDFSRFVSNAFANAQQSLKDYIRKRDQHRSAHNSGAAAIAPRLLEALADFRRDGFFATRDAALARKVWSKTRLERAQLRAKRRIQPTRHCVMPLALNSPGRDAIALAMEKTGVQELAASYLGKPVELYYAALDHAHDSQNWHRDCYADVGLDTSKTAYMHFDADCDIIKGLFYLEDVGDEDGPFRFLPGSHHWERAHFATAVQLGFDAASANEFAVCEDGLDYVSGYYRPRFQLAEQRRAMMSLPPALRGSTHFGDDLLDGSPLSNMLLEKEHKFVGPAGTLVMFDGSRGIHRGGQTGKNGSRWAVQVAFRVAQPRKKRSGLRKLAGKIKGRILYFYNAMQSIQVLRSQMKSKRP